MGEIPSCYAGKILRINLTDKTTEEMDTARYLPDFMGGRAMAARIFWEDVKPGVGAFDPENELIFMTGPTTGTAIPTGGRSTMVGISPMSLPEQFSYGSIGGWIGTQLKYCGYDGFILVGKAESPTYLLIEDSKVSFLDATPIWGQVVSATQESIRLAHGADINSMVIGPAGEHLHRNASITTSSDNAFARSGFGAVFGSKNLKAVAVRGTGKIAPENIEKMFGLRGKIGHPRRIPNPPTMQPGIGGVSNYFEHPYKRGQYACSPGCNSRCQYLMMGTNSPFTGGKVNQTEKCVSWMSFNYTYEHPFTGYLFVRSEKNSNSQGRSRSFGSEWDDTDPDLDMCTYNYAGDRMDLWGPDFDRGALMSELANEYGIDKWEVTIHYFTWLAMAKKEGLLDDMDLGMEVDVENPAFVKHFFDMMTYRTGPDIKLADGTERPAGDVFAEGMARAIRLLGKKRYGETIYHGRYNQEGVRLDIPVSLEAAWGYADHWQGRGFQSGPKWLWVSHALNVMVNTRDPFGSGHMHVLPTNVKKIQDDPSHSRLLVDLVIKNERLSYVKDSLTSCEWQAGDDSWPDMEVQMYRAATGDDSYTLDDIKAFGRKARLMTRAILMRNFGRCRDLEVENVYPFLTYPDPWGKFDTWDEWNDTVDLYYDANRWDRATGWPYREVWDEAGLSDVADELDALGMIPDPSKPYTRKANPFDR